VTEEDRIMEYVASLPDVSGTFTGIFSQDADVTAMLAELENSVPGLFPVEIDTGDDPNPAAGFMTELKFQAGGQEWVLPVDHVDLLGSNRVRVWVRRSDGNG
jgi:hypothetical protein